MVDFSIDMFDVQLGAAILLQMKDSGGNMVRVLADGGINARGYHRDHVAQRLQKLLPDRHLDVVVGTHYDKDHIAGLVDVADRFTIGTAFLPPVRRPLYPKPGTPEEAAIQAIGNPENAEDLKYLIELNDNEWTQYRQDLRRIASQTSRLLGEEEQNLFENVPDYDIESWEFRTAKEFSFRGAPFGLLVRDIGLLHLFQLRRSCEKGALVAKWLNQLVEKLRSRRPCVPIAALDIKPGEPRLFVWSKSKRQFAEELDLPRYSKSQEPKFTLLGPSRSLVAKYAKVLPVECYLALLGVFPRTKITASNELSYVMVFEATGQKVLITGDAGCVDFWEEASGTYHPKLLQSISGCNVIQVAHHAGNNYRFYDVLLKGGLQSGGCHPPFLLMSHASNDRFRPTHEFKRFTQSLADARQDYTLLTTTKPDPSKISDFKSHYSPAIPQRPSSKGDVRLHFDQGKWTVVHHRLQV